ncbi:hypothetical protein A3L04_02100 [Thermococcus chitonophagus]|uniref:Uncharacterized protein n=1 Tax=Thermococcus chitonophagus TaxID=54262 RepID=A0A160VS28_9EURY|nr:hypothetical protein [Thermococcus chitonophagus]ASJ15952.1 hypothetical protein A3L04_02100 [Thermococcus chitonophagus]CUX77196.1 hypothetical protein CHITON_0417 [Thermococcus chitonophagus]
MALKDALRYPTIFVGISLLFAALILSLVALDVKVVEKEITGNVTGYYRIQDEDIVTILSANLTLYSENATVMISWNKNSKIVNISGNPVTITNITDFPRISSSNPVRYSFAVVGYAYPYSYLSPLSFLIMIMGMALSIMGYISYMQGEMEKVKKRRREDTNGGEDVQGATWRKGGL